MIDIHCHRRNKWYLMDMYHIGFLIVFGILDLLWEVVHSYMEDKSHHIHQCIVLDLLWEVVHSYMEDKSPHIHQCIGVCGGICPPCKSEPLPKEDPGQCIGVCGGICPPCKSEPLPK